MPRTRVKDEKASSHYSVGARRVKESRAPAREEEQVMEESIKKLVGDQVEVRINGPEEKRSTYRGTLAAFDDPWVILREEAGRIYYFSVYAVVYVRPF